METLTQIIPGNWIYALGWTVVHSLWQGAILALLLSGFRWLAVRSAPQWRYMAGLVSLCCLFTASVFTFFVLWDAGGSAEGVVITLSGNADPADPSYLSRLTGYLNRQLPLLVGAWITGMLFFAARTAGGLWYIARLRKSTHFPVHADWEAKAGRMASRMKIRRKVSILESAHVNVPLVIGHFKPLILLPIGLVNQLSPTEVEAVLAHELAHIRRHDFLLNLLQSLLDILYYFNPAVWYISATIRTERENSCDDWAVEVCGSSLAYVHALVQLQERSGNMPQMALSMAGGGKPLLNRVRRILNQPNNKKSVMERFIATLLLLVAVAVFSVSASQPDEKQAPGSEARAALVSVENGLDTFPKVLQDEKVRIVKDKGDRRMELTLKNGDVEEFKVDGKVIPKEEQGAYQKDIDAMRADLRLPPPPPPPPPGAPLPPDAPEPPRPSKAPVYHMRDKNLDVRTETLEDGKVLIWVKEDHEAPIEIIVDGEDVQVNSVPGDIGEPAFFFPPEAADALSPEDREIIMQEHHRAMEEQGRAMEEHARAMEEQGRILEKEMEMMAKKRAEGMAERQKHLQDIELNAPRIFAPEPAVIFRGEGQGSLKAAIERELQRDGYIEPGGSYEFELSGKKLVINGKKESEVIFEKYRKIYERHTGLSLSKDSRIEIEE